MINDDLFLKSKAYKYFNKEMIESKLIRDSLVAFEEVLNIRRNIRSIYNTDNPDEVKLLIGKTINGVIIKYKDFEYVLLIYNTYINLYESCKKLLNKWPS